MSDEGLVEGAVSVERTPDAGASEGSSADEGGSEDQPEASS